jgi:hypothetical protein
VEEDAELRRAIKAEARKNFAMNAARRPRNLMGLKADEEEKAALLQAGKMARDLRKKYGGIVTKGEKDGKRGVPVDLLAEMQEIFNRDQRGLLAETSSPSPSPTSPTSSPSTRAASSRSVSKKAIVPEA